MGTAPDTSAEATRNQPADTTMSGNATPGGGAIATEAAAISVDDMMGKTVRGSDGETLGSVEDIIIDPQSGEARQLVLSSGGFLGIGAKQIAIDLASANLSSQDDALVLPNMTQADVEAMPEFEMEEGAVSFNTRPDATTGTTTQ
jgi:sporulation protein YlmC with PRC-barrel domain